MTKNLPKFANTGMIYGDDALKTLHCITNMTFTNNVTVSVMKLSGYKLLLTSHSHEIKLEVRDSYYFIHFYILVYL